MNQQILPKLFCVIVLLALYGCGGSQNVQVNELSNHTISYDEVIHINNCGGKANSEQLATRSFATTIGGEAEFKAGYAGVVQGSISAMYSEFKNISKSMRLIAPPGTNMEFTLRWSEEVHAGDVSAGGESGTYEVRIPIAVEQISSQDLGGCSTSSEQAPSITATTPAEALMITPTPLPPTVAMVDQLFLATDVPLAPLVGDLSHNPSQTTQAQLENAIRAIQIEAARVGGSRLENSSIDIPQGDWWLVWCSNAPVKYTNPLPTGWGYLFEQQLPTFGQLFVISPTADSRHIDSCNSPEGWWGVQVFIITP